MRLTYFSLTNTSFMTLKRKCYMWSFSEVIVSLFCKVSFFIEEKRFSNFWIEYNRLLTKFDPNVQKSKEILHFTSKMEFFEVNRNRISILTESLGTTAIWRVINFNSTGILLRNFVFFSFLEIVYFEMQTDTSIRK